MPFCGICHFGLLQSGCAILALCQFGIVESGTYYFVGYAILGYAIMAAINLWHGHNVAATYFAGVPIWRTTNFRGC